MSPILIFLFAVTTILRPVVPERTLRTVSVLTVLRGPFGTPRRICVWRESLRWGSIKTVFFKDTNRCLSGCVLTSIGEISILGLCLSRVHGWLSFHLFVRPIQVCYLVTSGRVLLCLLRFAVVRVVYFCLCLFMYDILTQTYFRIFSVWVDTFPCTLVTNRYHYPATLGSLWQSTTFTRHGDPSTINVSTCVNSSSGWYVNSKHVYDMHSV